MSEDLRARNRTVLGLLVTKRSKSSLRHVRSLYQQFSEFRRNRLVAAGGYILISSFVQSKRISLMKASDSGIAPRCLKWTEYTVSLERPNVQYMHLSTFRPGAQEWSPSPFGSPTGCFFTITYCIITQSYKVPNPARGGTEFSLYYRIVLAQSQGRILEWRTCKAYLVRAMLHGRLTQLDENIAAVM